MNGENENRHLNVSGKVKMKKAILYRVCWLAEAEEDEIRELSEDEGLEKAIWDHLPSEDIEIDKAHTLEWYSTQEIILNPESMNCGKCACCGAWTTDMERADPVQGISHGAVVEGKLYCDECLPPDHPWAF